MKKFIITGALGHIGSYFVRFLAREYEEVEIVMVDNLSSQRFPSLYNLPKGPKYSFIDEDIRELDLKNILNNADFCIHFAAITDAAGSFDNAEQLEANNFECTLKIAKECANYKVKLITLSSTSVYGTQNRVVAEDCTDEELKPQSPYASTKLKEETLIRDLVSKKKLESIILRFGTIYGTSPGMRFHTAVNKFCYQAAFKKPITVWSTAYDQKRPYLDINDASRALVHIINNDIFNGETYNILSNNATVREVTDLIKKYCPGLEISFVSNEIMNQLSYEVSNEKFKDTGFEFEGNMEKRISETLELLQ